jgi:ferritin-like metal-binding protein YciE
MELNDLKALYADELRDLYNAEGQTLKAFPELITAATNPALISSLQHHMDETGGHLVRLETIFRNLGEHYRGKVCRGMMGIIEEGRDLMADAGPDAIKDAAIITAAQRIEHYEMAGYGSVIAFANLLGDNDGVDLLQKTLDEEALADLKLTQIARSMVNIRAAKQEVAHA